MNYAVSLTFACEKIWKENQICKSCVLHDPSRGNEPGDTTINNKNDS